MLVVWSDIRGTHLLQIQGKIEHTLQSKVLALGFDCSSNNVKTTTPHNLTHRWTMLVTAAGHRR
jgi:hypothetical protein